MGSECREHGVDALGRFRRAEGSDGGSLSAELLDLHQRGMGRGGLRQAGGADVGSQHVGIAVGTERTYFAAFLRTIPGTFLNAYHAGGVIIAYHQTSQYLTAVVEYPHQIAVLEATGFGILWIHIDWLATLYRVGGAVVVGGAELAVQPLVRVAGLQVQRILFAARPAVRALVGLDPDRVTRTIPIAVVSDGLGVDLDKAGRGAERF